MNLIQTINEAVKIKLPKDEGPDKETETKLKQGTKRVATSALDAFLDDYEKETYPNPFFHRMRIWNDSIGMELYKSDGMIHISSIMSFDQKNAGNASRGMKWLTTLADKHGVKMDLDVKPIKNAGAREGKNLNKAQLKSWYKRNGFTSAGGDHMYRTPK